MNEIDLISEVEERGTDSGQTNLTKGRRSSLVLIGLFFFVVFTVVFSVCTGAMSISLNELWAIVADSIGLKGVHAYEESQKLILAYIRLPRICLGLLVGAGLGVAGAALQGLFRNPLADPTLVGISSGATLFAVVVIMFSVTWLGTIDSFLGSYTISVFAFLGACATTLLVYQLAKVEGQAQIATMLLAGIAINAFVGALIGLMTFISTDDQLRNITFWNLGSVAGATWNSVLTLLPFVATTVILMPRLAKSLNLLTLGEAQAGHLGANVKFLKMQIIVLATLAVGASVAMSGNIGFIGLLVPHIIRKAFGPDHKLVLPGAALAGAGILVLSDTLARTIVAPSELPLGVITALIGTPVFVYILVKEKKHRYD